MSAALLSLAGRPPDWVNGWLAPHDIPWVREDRGRSGTHCGGLVRLVFAEELRLDVPDYGPVPIGDGASRALVHRRLREWPWVQLPSNAVRRPFDLVVFQRGGVDDHVGIVVDRLLMLHLEVGESSAVTEIDGPRWARLLSGHYRHVALAGSLAA